MNSEGFPYADIVILALIAIFILLRLRSVLGSKSGDDTFNYFKKALPPGLAQQQEPVVQVDEKSLKPKQIADNDPYLSTISDGAIAGILRQIKEKDPQFTATAFMQGAKGAFEMVFDAFVKSDKATLKMLMSNAIYQHFASDIDTRDAQESKPETTLVSVKADGITHATLDRALARLSVRFLSEQVHVVRNAKGEIIEGDPSELFHGDDQWTFERDVTSKNPNWKIIET